jgi:hypothetical protein
MRSSSINNKGTAFIPHPCKQTSACTIIPDYLGSHYEHVSVSSTILMDKSSVFGRLEKRRYKIYVSQAGFKPAQISIARFCYHLLI